MISPRCPAWLTKWNYAHRGLHGSCAPENSLAAAHAAIRQGLGIECDIQLSSDHQAMVFHDWELDRMTSSNGPVGKRTASELGLLHLADSPEQIVSLAAFVGQVAGQVPLLVELKSRPEIDIVRLVEAVTRDLAAYEGDYAIMSFDPRICLLLAERHPGIIRGLVGTDSYRNGFEGMWRDQATLSRADPDFLAVDYRDLGRTEARRWRALCRPLLTWTIQTPDERSNAAALADALISEEQGL